MSEIGSKLSKLKQRLTQVQQDRQKLEGRIESAREQHTTLTKECRDKFNCSLDELPMLVESTRREIQAGALKLDSELSAAEAILTEIGGKK